MNRRDCETCGIDLAGLSAEYHTERTHGRKPTYNELLLEARESRPEAVQISKALDVLELGQSVGESHHQTWIIDQVARALLGDGYAAWVVKMNEGEDGPDTYAWEEGVAP